MKPTQKRVWRCENVYCRATLAVRMGEMWRLVSDVGEEDVRLGDHVVRVTCPVCGRENVWVERHELDRLTGQG